MQALTSGTMAGTGSFRCEECGYVVTLTAGDALPACSSCGGSSFLRASLFGSRFSRDRTPTARRTAAEREEWVARIRDEVSEPGLYLVRETDGGHEIHPLRGEWTRIGRSLAADVRLDDPTVSRRHALVVRQPDGVRVLDDRSLNGVFVNGRRVEWQQLGDGDELVVGRFRLVFVDLSEDQVPSGQRPLEATG
jgi:predicted  nucleic acid-binding Zn-ribbon protein